VDESIVDRELRVDPTRLASIGRMGGIGYVRTRDRFEMPMGRGALDVPPEAR
jgi:hypothetical protein